MKKLIVLLALLSTTAQAEGYFGIGIGQSKVKDTSFCETARSILDPGVSCDEKNTDSAVKFFAGNNFSENAAFEVSYIDLVQIDGNATGAFFGTPTSVHAETKASGFDIGFIGFAPVTEQFSLLGRVGIFFWSVDASASATVGGSSASNSESASGNSLSYGLGAKYDFTKSFSLRGEFQRFTDVGDKDTTGQSDVDLLSVNLIFKF